MKNCLSCNKEIPHRNYCSKCSTKRWRERHPGRMEELCSNYYKENKTKYIERAKQWAKDNPESQSTAHAKWAKKSNYCVNRYRSDINYRLIKIQRARIRDALKGLNKSQVTKDLIGCSINELKTYLESKFLPGMTWDNYGKFGWHVDHIIPISKFDLSDPEQLKQACNYSNLQPLWWRDNIVKRDKT